MTEKHELYARLLSGDLRPDDPEARSLLDERPELRRELAEQAQVTSLLDAAGAAQRSTLEEAAERPEPSVEALETALRQVLAAEDAPRRRRLLALASLLAAAAVLITAQLFLRARDAAPAGDEPYYLDDEGTPELLEPRGGVQEFTRFAWALDLPPGGSFRVVVRANDELGTPLGESPRLRTSEWAPTPEERAGWPDGVTWEVEVYDATGNLMTVSSPARAERSGS